MPFLCPTGKGLQSVTSRTLAWLHEFAGKMALQQPSPVLNNLFLIPLPHIPKRFTFLQLEIKINIQELRHTQL